MSLCCLRLRRYPSRLPHYLPVFLRETSCVFEVRSWDASTCLAASTCLDVLAGAVEGPPRSLSLPPRRGQRVAPTQLRPEHLVAARWRPRVRSAPNNMYTMQHESESVSTVICTKQLCLYLTLYHGHDTHGPRLHACVPCRACLSAASPHCTPLGRRWFAPPPRLRSDDSSSPPLSAHGAPPSRRPRWRRARGPRPWPPPASLHVVERRAGRAPLPREAPRARQ